MLHLTETILRDANQSLAATRMPRGDFAQILRTMDQVGYYSVECWGGATFDSCIRYLNEDPWERLRFIREHMPNTKLQMLLRGQNLLGYTHYPTQVVDDFIKNAVKSGIDIIRIFDALNDLNNLKDAVESCLKYGAHPSCAISYTVSPVHTVESFVRQALEMEQMGAASICIKDMSGCLMPGEAYRLISELKSALDIPVILHSHCTAGVAPATYLKAIEAGVDVLDTAISPFSGGTSQPPTETVALLAENLGRKTAVDMNKLTAVAAHFKPVFDKMVKEQTIHHNSTGTDPQSLINMVPGGMYSNLLKQLKDQGNEQRMSEVLEEVPRVRKDMGYPPLVTPMSQIVGTQAVANVLMGQRYGIIIKELRAYVRGEYGKTPSPIDPEIKQRVLSEGGVSQSQDTDYAALREELEAQGYGEDDILTALLFPKVADKFFQTRNGVPVEPDRYTFKETFDPPSGKQLNLEAESETVALLMAILATNLQVTPEELKVLSVYEDDVV